MGFSVLCEVVKVLNEASNRMGADTDVQKIAALLDKVGEEKFALGL
jgi:hypothetical protein